MKLFSKDRPEPVSTDLPKSLTKGQKAQSKDQKARPKDQPKAVAEERPKERRSVLQNMGVYFRFLQAAAVLFLDKRLKRDPLVADRLKQMRAQQEFTQLIVKNPSIAKSLPAGSEDQAKDGGPMLDMLEREIKKNPTVTMSQLADLQKNPPAPQTKLRTRPGPPTRGRGRY